MNQPSLPPRHAVVIFSGGLDSTTAAYRLAADGVQPTLLSVDYGQRHRTELGHAARLARILAAPHHVVDLKDLGVLLGGSSLTDEVVEVPDGHYTDASMRVTVVPNRNAIMLDVAVAALSSRCGHGGVRRPCRRPSDLPGLPPGVPGRVPADGRWRTRVSYRRASVSRPRSWRSEGGHRPAGCRAGGAVRPYMVLLQGR